MSTELGCVIVAFTPPAAVIKALQKMFAPVHVAGQDITAAEVVALAQAHKAQGLLLNGAQKFDAAALDALPQSVRVIATSSVGFDHIAVAHAQHKGIVVSHTPHVLTGCTADLTMLLLLGAARRGRAYLDIMRAGWPERLGQADMLGQRLAGRTLGIVGMGRIGQAVAARARAFGMSIIYHNRKPLSDVESQGARYCPQLDELLAESQIVSLHAPGTQETRHLIDSRALARMPQGGILINVARGSLVDEAALYESLVSGHLFAAGLDVFAHEPGGHSGLMQLPQVFATPHVGSATIETRVAMGQMCIAAIAAVLAGKPPQYAIAPM